ncbi:MAG: hypothetical protein HND52_09795 [Ignavibacteriae bacterium]|nr:hypothetical protein [Ignavibacteriota bacterium]NOG98240.1 hypothetical protein [Ignavibacteriota bacterium]
MFANKNIPKLSFLFTIMFFLNTLIIHAQDSLYLVGTITGESVEKQITDVKGVGDINGDGYDDFMVSSRTGKLVRDQGIIKLYLGASDGNLIPDVTFHYPGADTLNYFGTAYGIGDINNDSYDDFAISGLFADFAGYAKGKVFIYLGGSTIDTIPVKEFYEPLWIQDDFGYPTEAIGDINKDGYDDFIVNSPHNWSNFEGYAYLFWGGDTISWERCDTLSGDLFYPQSFANIGDINNDSFDDLAIGVFEHPLDPDTGKVFIYYGGKQMDTQPDTVLTSDSSDYAFGRIIKNAGDLNNDGIIDFCILGDPHILIYVNYFVDPLKVDSYSLGAGGDINYDGFSDLLVGNDKKIKVYWGSENFDTTNYSIIEPPDSSSLSASISIVGDINNDGYDELASYTINYPSTQNPRGIVYIYSYIKITNVKDDIKTTPNNFQLYQNYPNPFNPITTIKYAVPSVADALNASTTNILLKVYDVLGNEIATLVDEQKHPGIYEVELDARLPNRQGSNLSSGVYFYRLQAGNPSPGSGQVFTETKKFILMK